MGVDNTGDQGLLGSPPGSWDNTPSWDGGRLPRRSHDGHGLSGCASCHPVHCPMSHRFDIRSLARLDQMHATR